MIKVLLVDDDAKLLRSISRHFEENDMEVETAISAAEAKVLLGRESFDAMICDNQMCGTNGTTLLTQIRKDFPKMARFMLSGDISRRQAYLLQWEVGVHAIFAKPCDLNELAIAVKETVHVIAEQVNS